MTTLLPPRVKATLRVTVVVPVRDGAAMVGECVRACLAQSLRPAEVIVVDNGSRDETAAVARAAGATVLAEPVRGSYRARNRGWRSTDSEIIAFTDGDCVPDPNWLANLMGPFTDPSVAAVGGAIVQDELKSASQRWMVERRFLDQAQNAAHEFLPFFAGRLVYRPTAEVRHHVGENLSEVTERWYRYEAEHILLKRRWSGWPGYPPSDRFFSRTKRVWQLPLSLGNRLLTGRPLSIALIDAAAAISRERGRLRGRIDARNSTLMPMVWHDNAIHDHAPPEVVRDAAVR
jgi:glycosyltransferase involved in cell wall biosynthesis